MRRMQDSWTLYFDEHVFMVNFVIDVIYSLWFENWSEKEKRKIK